MKILAVDDDKLSLEYMEVIFKQVNGISSCDFFSDPEKALEWCTKNNPTIAFLDIQMEKMDGLTLAKKIREKCPKCYIVFVTAFEEFALDAFRLHVSGYIVKPITKEDIEHELAHIKKYMDAVNKENVLRIQCFGNFDCYVNAKPLRFRHTKTKELLAYLVHRKGATCSVGELAAVLFEYGDDYKSQQSRLRTLFADLNHTLSEAEVEDSLYKTRGFAAIIPENVQCDFYDYIKKSGENDKNYYGEYMAQYSWAEEVVGYIENAN